MNKSVFLLSSLLCGIVLLLAVTEVLAEPSSPPVTLWITGVNVSRINLNTQEIDVEIQNLKAFSNQRFVMVMSRPYLDRRSSEDVGIGFDKSESIYQFTTSTWPWKSITIWTGPSAINLFPFEYYETEIIFGFNSTDVRTELVFQPFFSGYLEQEGQWKVTGRMENTSDLHLKWPAWEKEKEKYSNFAFRSLIIQLSHPPRYIARMFLSSWGPLLLSISIVISQFGFLGSKISRTDHITMFAGVSIFNAGQVLAVLQVTPPQLTAIQLSYLILSSAQLCLLVRNIRKDTRTCLEKEGHVPGNSALTLAVIALVATISMAFLSRRKSHKNPKRTGTHND